MYQFFAEPSQIQGDRILITGKDVNHIKNVLRLKPGEEISVRTGCDGREYRCGIEELKEDEIVCQLRFIKEEGLELLSKIYLFQGLPKGDKMELIVQKAVELGVYEIIPVASRRAVVKLDEKKAKTRVARWQGIAQAAAQQSYIRPEDVARLLGIGVSQCRPLLQRMVAGGAIVQERQRYRLRGKEEDLEPAVPAGGESGGGQEV